MPITSPLMRIEKRNLAGAAETGTNAATTREKVTIPVKGMTCAACQARVQRALPTFSSNSPVPSPRSGLAVGVFNFAVSITVGSQPFSSTR